MDMNSLPRNWPDHFEEAIKILNSRILPSLKFSPKELLLGMVINMPKTPFDISTLPPQLNDLDTHLMYMAQQRLDGYSEAVRHANQRKEAFDRKVTKSKAGPVIFNPGQLVQVFRSDLANSISSERKLTPMWSTPRRVERRNVNSYKLETLDGAKLEGEYSARRLREFVPCEGTDLAEGQRVYMERIRKEEVEQLRKEAEEVARLRARDDEDRFRLELEKTNMATMEDIIGPTFFYDEEAEEIEQIEGEGIAQRVSRRRGRRHEGGGQME